MRGKHRVTNMQFQGLFRVKANLHWEVARSSRARFFVCTVAPRSSRAEPCASAELHDATKQTKNRARLLLPTSQCWLASTVDSSYLQGIMVKRCLFT